MTSAKGIGITLPLQLGNTGYFNQSFDTLAQVKSNFINLILTKKGERVHQPEFGCSIHSYIFEPLTPDNIEGARLSVLNAVERWMPFLELIQFDIQAESNDVDSNKMKLYVGYRLRRNPGIRDSIILTF
jgi:phage baseplate assembly protein W